VATALNLLDFRDPRVRPSNPQRRLGPVTHGPAWREPDDTFFVRFGALPFAGGSIGVSRSVYEEVGGSPSKLPRMYDIAFSWEGQFAGRRCTTSPEAVYRVGYRESLRGLFRQGFAECSTAPLLYKRYRAVVFFP
jgi:hypothetical protein